MKSTKKSIWASGLSLIICAAMLVGTTFAWFTDSVTNTGNKIQSGSLLINAYAYDVDPDGTGGYTIAGVNGDKAFTFEATPQDLKKETKPIISEDLFEPGKSNAKLLKVENAGTLAAKIKLSFTVNDGGLADALWFDFVQVENGAIKGTFTKRPMSELSALAENLEFGLLQKGDTIEYILVYGMDEGAGNAYQNKTFSADVNILAAQYTYEKDGFGDNQYDKDAQYEKEQNLDSLIAAGYTPVASADELTKALEFTDSEKTDAKIVLAGDISMIDLTRETAVTIPAGKNVTLDLNGSNIYAKESTNSGVYGFITVSNTSALVLDDSTGNGKITFEYDGGNANYAGKAAVLCQGEMIMNGGTIAFEGNGHEILSFGIDLRPNAWGADYKAAASFTMNGGSIIGDDECEAIRLANSSGGNVPAAKNSLVKCTINDGTIYGWDAIFMQQIDSVFKPFEVEINGGSLTGVNYAVRIYNAYENWSYADPDKTVVNTVKINGGKLTDGGNELPVVDGVAIRTPNGTYDKFMETVAVDSVIDKTENIPTP